MRIKILLAVGLPTGIPQDVREIVQQRCESGSVTSLPGFESQPLLLIAV